VVDLLYLPGVPARLKEGYKTSTKTTILKSNFWASFSSHREMVHYKIQANNQNWKVWHLVN